MAWAGESGQDSQAEHLDWPACDMVGTAVMRKRNSLTVPGARMKAEHQERPAGFARHDQLLLFLKSLPYL